VPDTPTNTPAASPAAPSTDSSSTPAPVLTAAPVAPRRPVETVLHGDSRIDEYGWLRNRDNPEVIAHLEAENAWTEQALAHLAPLREQLFSEIKGRVQETDLSLPYAKGPWVYLTRTIEGLQYAIHLRRPRDRAEDESADQVLIDENVLAEGHEYFSLGSSEVSPDHRWLAWSTDTEGSEQYVLRFRDLNTGLDLPEAITNTSPGTAWSAGADAVYYLTLDQVMRPHQVWRHVPGTDPSTDVLVFEEPDEQYFVGVGVSSSEELLVISVGGSVTSEMHVLPRAAANEPDGSKARFVCVEPREHGIEYGVDHHRSADGTERLLIVTNAGREGFRLMTAPVGDPRRANWVDTGLIPQTDEPYPVKFDGVEVFRDHLISVERTDAVVRLRIVDLEADGTFQDKNIRTLTMPDDVSSAFPGGNPEFASSTLRFTMTSMTTPTSVYEENLLTSDRTLLKRQVVLGDFDPDIYVGERVWATADDGEQVPISVVRRRDTPVDGTAPLMLYGYGSYEASMDPVFSAFRLSLLDRGMVFAIAHIRGGGERGRRWYLDGKLEKKTNTFTDFIACAHRLIETGHGAPGRLVARGGSAGGLLMGAVANMAPTLFTAIVAEVPFVDVVSTMLDESLPLTAFEWEEWGNPTDPEVYARMKAYGPYENVAATAYPSMLITGGLNDPRVGFWEPAKWHARLRERATGGPFLLKTELGAGHAGPSGRYGVWRDESFVLAFILDAVGLGAPLS
jgi:oligopeptidase B